MLASCRCELEQRDGMLQELQASAMCDQEVQEKVSATRCHSSSCSKSSPRKLACMKLHEHMKVIPCFFVCLPSRWLGCTMCWLRCGTGSWSG